MTNKQCRSQKGLADPIRVLVTSTFCIACSAFAIRLIHPSLNLRMAVLGRAQGEGHGNGWGLSYGREGRYTCLAMVPGLCPSFDYAQDKLLG